MDLQMENLNDQANEAAIQEKKIWSTPMIEFITIKNTASGDGVDATFGIGSDS